MQASPTDACDARFGTAAWQPSFAEAVVGLGHAIEGAVESDTWCSSTDRTARPRRPGSAVGSSGKRRSDTRPRYTVPGWT